MELCDSCGWVVVDILTIIAVHLGILGVDSHL